VNRQVKLDDLEGLHGGALAVNGNVLHICFSLFLAIRLFARRLVN